MAQVPNLLSQVSTERTLTSVTPSSISSCIKLKESSSPRLASASLPITTSSARTREVTVVSTFSIGTNLPSSPLTAMVSLIPLSVLQSISRIITSCATSTKRRVK